VIPVACTGSEMWNREITVSAPEGADGICLSHA